MLGFRSEADPGPADRPSRARTAWTFSGVFVGLVAVTMVLLTTLLLAVFLGLFLFRYAVLPGA